MMYLLFSACSTSGNTSLVVDTFVDTAIDDRREEEPLVEELEEPEEVEEEHIFGEYWVGSRDVFFDDGKPDKVWAVPHSAHEADHKDDAHSAGEAH